MKVYAIIPSYNPGAAALLEVVAGTAAQLGRDAVLVIDDGSSDGSGARVAEQGFTVITHSVNQGKGAALRTGFAAALEGGADWVVTLDADGQHDPTEIPSFVAAATAGDQQLLVGSRMGNIGDMPFLRVFANRVTSWVVSALAGQRVEDSQSGFRCVAAEVLRAVRLEFQRYDAESEILVRASRAGFKLGSIPIRTIYGEEESAINPWVDTLRFVRMVWRLARLR